MASPGPTVTTSVRPLCRHTYNDVTLVPPGTRVGVYDATAQIGNGALGTS
jgi:hypothetical protein